MEPPPLVGAADHRAALRAFLLDPSPRPRVAVVHAPRRAGLSTLLTQALAERAGHRIVVTTNGGVVDGGGDTRGRGTQALHAALSVGGRTAPWTAVDGVDRLLVAERTIAGELAARLAGADDSAGPVRWILAGSAAEPLRALLAPDGPLAIHEPVALWLAPDDHRQLAATMPDPRDLLAATRVYAVLGGVVGYRTSLVSDDLPTSVADVERWLVTRVLSPASALHREAVGVLAEDVGLSGVDVALQQAVLAALAARASTAAAIAAAVDRPVSNLTPILRRLVAAGYVHRDEDPLRRQRPTYGIAHELLRFHHAVLEPFREQLTSGDPRRWWRRHLRRVFDEQVRDPAFTSLVRRWLTAYAGAETLPGTRATIAPSGVDRGLLVVADGDPDPSRRHVEALVRVRARARLGLADLDAVLAIRSRLGARAADARLLLVGADADDDLRAVAAGRGDVEVVDLERLMLGH